MVTVEDSKLLTAAEAAAEALWQAATKASFRVAAPTHFVTVTET